MGAKVQKEWLYKAKPKRKRKSPEADEQRLFFHLINCFHKDLRPYIWHTPNGGSRDVREAINLKKMGVLKGVWDVTVSIPRGGWAGMYIEFKSDTGKLTKEQKEFEERMSQHYACFVARNAETALEVLKGYLGIDDVQL